MSYLIANANGNLTGTSWANVSAAGLLDSEASSLILTTANQDSAAFVLEANQIDGVAIKLANRGATPGAATLTLTLRNSTTATDIWTQVLNQSDFDAATTGDDEGGWYLVMGAAPHTPNGTDSYILRLKVSSNTCNISFYTNATSANWARMIRRTNAVSPAAADVLHIIGEWTAAATKTNRTITMDSTATTAYGGGVTGVGGIQTPGFGISKGGLLIYGTTASTNYVLRLNGTMVVYSSGTLNIGTVATPVPRNSTAVLEFSCPADDNFGLILKNNHTVTMQGLSRTSGKNVVWTLLTADISVAATSSTVADDTGWLSGDTIAIAQTSMTQTDSEQLALTGNATSSTLAHGAAAVAHKGTVATLTQAEVILLTRNVRIRATNASFGFRFEVWKTGTCDIDWCEIQYGSNATSCIRVLTTTGMFTLSYCSFRDMRGGCVIQSVNPMAAGATVVIEHTVTFNTSGQAAFYEGVTSTGGSYTLNDVVIVKMNGGFDGITFSDNWGGSLTVYPTLTNIRIVGTTGGARGFAPSWGARDWIGSPPIGPFVMHGCSGDGLQFQAGGTQLNLTIAGITSWRNSGAGIRFPQSAFFGLEITSALLYGNTTGGIQIGSPSGCMFQGVIRDLRAYGDSVNNQPSGISVAHAAPAIFELRVEKADLGTASGVWIAHTVGDIAFACVRILSQMTVNNAKLSSTTPVAAFTYAAGLLAHGSYIQFQRYQQTATQHKTLTLEGTLAYETTTVDVSPSLKMTPLIANRKLKSHAGIPGSGFLVPVLSGTTPTVSLKVRKDGSYNGNQPRLILAQNSALGLNADSILATLTVGTNTWETLSAALPSATDDGVWEVYVDCDGTAGNVFVDTGSVTP